MTRLKFKPSQEMLANRVYARRFAKCDNCKHSGDATHLDLCKECYAGKKKKHWEPAAKLEEK